MTQLNKFKSVTKAELDKFVREYPNRLTRDVCAIREPAGVSFNDFTEGKEWPESIVAKRYMAIQWGGAGDFKVLKESPKP